MAELRSWSVLLLLASCTREPSQRVQRALAVDQPLVEGSLDAFVEHLDARVPSLMDLHGTAGLALALVENGEVVATRAYGVVDRESGERVTADSMFVVASVSKTATAFGALELVESGVVGLDEPLLPRLPGFELPNDGLPTAGVTIRRLLDHTAGISMRGLREIDPAHEAVPSLEEYVAAEGVRLAWDPGSRQEYSGGGYAIVQLAVDRLSGRTFAEHMRTSVFEPLGMTNSSFAQDESALARVVTPYVVGAVPWRAEVRPAAAAHGLATTAPDLARLVAVMVGGRSMLRRESLAALTTPTDESGSEALGVEIVDLADGTRAIQHPGGDPGWRARFMALPAEGDAIVLVANATTAEPVQLDVVCAWLRWKSRTPHADACRPQSHGLLALEGLEGGVRPVERALEAFERDPQSRYSADPLQLLRAASLLRLAGQRDTAREVCELAHHRKEKGAACFVELAKAAERLYELDEAKAMVERALEIEPADPRLRARLEALAAR